MGMIETGEEEGRKEIKQKKRAMEMKEDYICMYMRDER